MITITKDNKMKEKLEQRIKDIEQALIQSAANHNALNGRLEEAKFQLSELEEVAEVTV